jgi:sterol desaturase/sphingolipid hydroxylase (fatty acid hydroxylase superfamily)
MKKRLVLYILFIVSALVNLIVTLANLGGDFELMDKILAIAAGVVAFLAAIFLVVFTIADAKKRAKKRRENPDAVPNPAKEYKRDMFDTIGNILIFSGSLIFAVATYLTIGHWIQIALMAILTLNIVVAVWIMFIYTRRYKKKIAEAPSDTPEAPQ